MATGITAINEKVKKESGFVERLKAEIGKAIVGQGYLIDRLIVGLLANGHILVEGVPGLAKTLSIKTISQAINTRFQRIQFTPDLLPADLIGTLVYNPKEGTFTTKKGPIFANIILADEINRAPAKVQSALLEAMMERQVTIGENTYKLDDPFLVLATQNPIEQEGTYPLPEAQIDRFMLKLSIGYPNKEEELEIMRLNSGNGLPEPLTVGADGRPPGDNPPTSQAGAMPCPPHQTLRQLAFHHPPAVMGESPEFPGLLAVDMLTSSP